MENETILGIVAQSDRRWALINSGTVESVILWDGSLDTYTPDLPYIELESASPVGPGWTYDGENFAEPVSPEE